jgi:hypothetical protein
MGGILESKIVETLFRLSFDTGREVQKEDDKTNPVHGPCGYSLGFCCDGR